MKQIAERLAKLLNVEPGEVHLRADVDADGVVEAGPFAFAVDWKSSGTAATVAASIEQVRHRAEEMGGNVVPLVVVPFMGESGRGRCADADVAWVDLSGNARIFAPGLRILVEGKPNRYKRRGRPSSAFAPKSSRIARWLLMHPMEFLTQREIAKATHTDEGYTSRIVGKLEDDGLLVRDTGGAIKPRDPGLLLDAWREAYNFSKHRIIRGHVAARAGDALLHQLADVLSQASIGYAATGLAAAWLLDRFAGFRTVTLYLPETPAPDLQSALAFREDARGANVWLVVPNDEGVFHGAALHEGVRCVHPVQAYLDLHAHPERADEAAQKLRAEHLNWRIGG
ncbi:MAG: hypothetical protein GY946_25055 [bacterium]|nr:hypothetical protein [bacterium]